MQGLCLVVCALALSADNAPPVKWGNNYSDALKVTKAAAKPLLVVVENPAQAAARAGFVPSKPDKTQAELLQRFELCRIDARTDHGKKVVAAFNVTEYPFTAIIDKSGSGILYQRSGQLTAEEWGKSLETYQGGRLPGSFLSGGSNCFT